MCLRYVSFVVALITLSWVSDLGASTQAPAPAWPPAPPRISVELLPAGVRVIHLPDLFAPRVDSNVRGVPPGVDIAFGFSASPPSDVAGKTIHGLVRSWLFRSVPARTVELIAHLGGGTFQFAEYEALTGLRVRVPPEQVDAVLKQIADFLDQSLADDELLDYVTALERDAAAGDDVDARNQAVQAVTAVLIESASVADALGPEEPSEWPAASAVVQYFRANFGTDRAWVMLSEPPDERRLEYLRGIRPRPSSPRSSMVADEMNSPDPATLSLPSRPEGGLVMGSRISSVYYEGWFNTLLVDRAIRRILGPPARLSFAPSREPSVHLIETPVLFPDYPGEVAERIWSDLVMLQTDVPGPSPLSEIKQDALAYLAERSVLEWFAAEDLWRPLEEGWARVWNLTEAEFRSSVGSFLGESRLIASWAPAFDSPTVVVESLDDFVDQNRAEAPVRIAPGRVQLPAMGDTNLPSRLPVTVRRLSSGVGVAAGPPAIFVAGPGPEALAGGQPQVGPNGTFWSFPDLPGEAVLRALDEVRSDRLFFFLPSSGSAGLQNVLAQRTGGTTDATSSLTVGDVATIDLPALVILKVWLDRKIIEAGWSGLVDIAIRATGGSRLSIDADAVRREEIDRWLSEASAAFDGEAGAVEFSQLQAGAGVYFDQIRGELQILLSQRAPGGEIPPPDRVSLSRFRNFLEVYF